MSELTPHLDDFLLLRYCAGELEDAERLAATRHLEACGDCAQLLQELRRLDADCQILASEDPSVFVDPERLELAWGDPFRARPEVRPPVRDRSIPPVRLAELALDAARRGGEGRSRLLEAVGDPRRLRAALEELSLAQPADRFALLYALQQAGPKVVDGPVSVRRFAESALSKLRAREPDADGSFADEKLAERVVPRLILLGQAHLLAGQACNWMGELEIARTHAELAYSSFSRGGDEIALAYVELLESQRRYLDDRGRDALLLARRAAATFASLGLEESLARARGAEGIALYSLGRAEEALASHRSTLPVFEEHGLWANYVVALNNAAVSLVKLGRLDEARREYARALRRLSRGRHRAILAFIRHGLAEVLFAAGHYREAARAMSSARLRYGESGQRANALAAWLFEVESWARSGDLPRAQSELEAFRSALTADRLLDPATARQVERALSRLDPDLANIADFRREAEVALPPARRGITA